MDPWEEAINCYEEFADEVIVLGENFKTEFEFSDFGPMFDEGFEKANGDWVIKMDIDTLIHEKDFEKLRRSLKDYSEYPGISLRKFQFFTPKRFHTKSRMGMVLNKKKFKNIKFNGGGDGCDPTVNNNHITEKNVPRIPVPFWNYDSVFKSKNIISKDRARFARAWNRYFNDWGNRGGPSEEEAYSAWIKMVSDRYIKHALRLKIDDHPKYIKNKLINLKDNQFGFDAFGMKGSIKPSFFEYLKSSKNKFFDLKL